MIDRDFLGQNRQMHEFVLTIVTADVVAAAFENDAR